jgi:hypothetical protein
LGPVTGSDCATATDAAATTPSRIRQERRRMSFAMTRTSYGEFLSWPEIGSHCPSAPWLCQCETNCMTRDVVCGGEIEGGKVELVTRPRTKALLEGG